MLSDCVLYAYLQHTGGGLLKYLQTNVTADYMT